MCPYRDPQRHHGGETGSVQRVQSDFMLAQHGHSEAVLTGMSAMLFTAAHCVYTLFMWLKLLLATVEAWS